MVAVCNGDPLVCIEFAVLFTGEFLKDWTTMAMLALLLGLLLSVRADRRTAAEADHARRLLAYDKKRTEETRARSELIKLEADGEAAPAANSSLPRPPAQSTSAT